MLYKILLSSVFVFFIVACESDKEELSTLDSQELKQPKPAIQQNSDSNSKYPVARKSDHTDDYFGTKIKDPYRWMEDIDSEETKAWVKQQQDYTASYFNRLDFQEPIKERLTELWNYEKYSVPQKNGDTLFFEKNSGLQNQNVLYVQDKPDSEPRVLLDPNTISEDGTVALKNYTISEDGTLLAYGLSKAGSDWQEWRFINIKTGEKLNDKLEWIKFSVAKWSKDGNGVYYSRYEAPTKGELLEQVNNKQKLYYHRLGTDQKNDSVVYERPDQPEWGFSGEVTDDGNFLIITVRRGTYQNNRFFYKRLKDSNANVVELLNDFDAEYVYLGNIGSDFYFKTDLDAPNGRVISININKPERQHWREIISESLYPLRSVTMLNNQFVVHRLKDVTSAVTLYSLNGSESKAVTLPGKGTIRGFDGKLKDADCYFSFTDYIRPTEIYRYDFKTDSYSLYKKPRVHFKPELFISEQVFYESKDGTRIPMFISYKKGLKKNSQNPTLLYAYGGFSIAIMPQFSPANIVWMEMGGVYAVPSLRGGSEYGEVWHRAGMYQRKQNVFDDFYSAGEYLIAKRYTSKEKLGIHGRSNGGLLVGAALTQRPELFAVAIPAVGVMDMLRFQKFTIGWGWVSEYGSSDNMDQFKYLIKYSPLHNLKKIAYPPTMIMTADHDDRVVPSHSFKFAATMQAMQQGNAPILARIESNAGHGSGKPTVMKIMDNVDKFMFLLENMNYTLPDMFVN